MTRRADAQDHSGPHLRPRHLPLANDFINIDIPAPAHPEMSFDWARVMDSTRRSFGNDLPWRGRRVRTYKHYVVSPNPKDGIGLEALRELATAWAIEHFFEYEVAIVYHDDNQNGIPHAHVVVNNTNIETGRRLQDPDTKALASSLQDIAERQGLSVLRPPEPSGVTARAQRRNPKRHPETYRSEYVRRSSETCSPPWASPYRTTRPKRSDETGYTRAPTIPPEGSQASAWGSPTGANGLSRFCARAACAGLRTPGSEQSPP